MNYIWPKSKQATSVETNTLRLNSAYSFVPIGSVVGGLLLAGRLYMLQTASIEASLLLPFLFFLS